MEQQKQLFTGGFYDELRRTRQEKFRQQFDNQDFGIYGRGYEGYAHYMQAVKESGSSISDDFPFDDGLLDYDDDEVFDLDDDGVLLDSDGDSIYY